MADAATVKKPFGAGIMSTTEKSASPTDGGLPPDVAAVFEEFSGAKYRKLMRKMDMRLIPIVSHVRTIEIPR